MKKSIVVGAGVAGLAAAIYAQRSGVDVTLIEQHSITGGMCTSWKRKGYLFEGAMHWLTGSGEKSSLHRLWLEVGALDSGVEVLYPEVFRAAEWQGQTLRLYRSADKTRDELLAACPEDEKAIRQMHKDIKRMRGMQMPVTDIKGLQCENPAKMGMGAMLALVLAMPAMGRLNKISVEEYVKRFHQPGLQRLLIDIVPKEYTAFSLLVTLATLDMGDGGFPQGGSLGHVQRMQKTFLALGGTLRLNTRVQEVLLENGSATGVRLQNESLLADAVVITVETKAAMRSLFKQAPKDEWLQELCGSIKPSTCTFVCIGVRAPLPETPAFALKEPIRYAGRETHFLAFNNYYGYEAHAPEGGTALTAVFMGDTYEYWEKANAEGRYEQEKQALAAQVKAALEQKYPQTAGKIEVVDVATPLTYERYTGATHGAWMSVTTPGDKMARYDGVVKSTQGLYFAGHCLMPPGGLPSALCTGRTAAQHVCRQLDVVFC